jgi:hypothetical protein
MPLEPVSCVVQEFFGGIATLFCGASQCSNAVLDSIGNRAGGAGSLTNRFADLFGSLFYYALCHSSLPRFFQVNIPYLCGERARSMVALTRNLDVFGSRVLTGLAAVFVASTYQAPARQVPALLLFSCHD